MTSKLYFLNHSGFILELPEVVYVFDFYQDPAQVLSRYENTGKKLVFFVSHKHPDHWNPDIFSFRNTCASYYFCDTGVKLDGERFKQINNNCKVTYVKAGTYVESTELESAGIDKMFCPPSTDAGVAFCFKAFGNIIYHAGDLNAWNWGDSHGESAEQWYRSNLEQLTLATKTWSNTDVLRPFIAFVPTDGRMGKHSLTGAKILLDYMRPKYLVPMHLNGGLDIPERLASMLASDPATETVKVLTMIEAGDAAYLQ